MTPTKPQFLRTTLSQLAIVIVALPIAYVIAGTASTVSLLCGAMCAVIPQAYFALKMARASQLSAQSAARQGLLAEGGKFALSAVGFAVVFATIKPEQPGLVFLGFVVLWLVQLVATVGLLRKAPTQ